MTRGPRLAPHPRAPGAALFECRVTHTRLAPWRNAFTYRTYQWLVDLDHLPRLAPGLRLLAGFRGRDHMGDPSRRSGRTSTVSSGPTASTWPAAGL